MCRRYDFNYASLVVARPAFTSSRATLPHTCHPTTTELPSSRLATRNLNRDDSISFCLLPHDINSKLVNSQYSTNVAATEPRIYESLPYQWLLAAVVATVKASLAETRSLKQDNSARSVFRILNLQERVFLSYQRALPARPGFPSSQCTASVWASTQHAQGCSRTSPAWPIRRRIASIRTHWPHSSTRSGR